MACWIERSNGIRLRIDSGGIVVGRSFGCDVMLTDQRASSFQCLIRVGPQGPEVLPLGRNPTLVDQAAISAATLLCDGQTLTLPGEELVLRTDNAPCDVWYLQVWREEAYTVTRTPFSLGRSEQDRLQIPDWPPGAAT